MKNILENKTKFFTQYWGQKVLLDSVAGLLKIDGKIEGNYHGWKLELKPLSQITDEDAIEVAKMQVFRYDNGERTNMFEHYTNYMGEKSEQYVKSLLRNSVYNDEFSLYVYDFLRSKGYALPWNGISVEEQIEFGWIKLKES